MRKLDFKALPGTSSEDEIEDELLETAGEGEAPQPRSWRRSRHDANPTVQMSVRMPEETYERFRALCQRERRTNGDMLRVLMEGYGTKGSFKKGREEG